MKKILLTLALLFAIALSYSQTPDRDGTKIRNAIYTVYGTDTIWIQSQDTTALFYTKDSILTIIPEAGTVNSWVRMFRGVTADSAGLAIYRTNGSYDDINTYLGAGNDAVSYLNRYTGNICVGSSTAAQKFTVVGTMSSTGQTYLGTGPAVTVGIGTTTASEVLQVDGNTELNSTYAYMINDTNVAKIRGTNFMYGSQNTTIANAADFNTFVGLQAGTANTSGDWNTFIGAFSGYTNTTGSKNTAVGINTLVDLAGGESNTSLGVDAGKGIVTGVDNISIGDHSNYANNSATSDRNIAIGSDANDAATSSQDVIAIGHESLTTNNGDYNIAIGSESGKSNTTGTGNTYIGWRSGRANTTGIYNAFLGDETVSLNNASGDIDANTAVGWRSLYSLAAGGGYNTALGITAGYSVTTGDSNIFIGAAAGYNETGSNKLYIEPTTSATPLIHGDFTNDSIRINGTLRADTLFALPDVGVHFIESDSVINHLAAGVYYTIKMDAGAANNMTTTDSTLVIPKNGYYELRYSISATHATNTTIIHASVFVDDVEETEIESERLIGAGGDLGCFGSGGVLFLEKGDVIKLKTKADKTGNQTISHANFTVKRLN